MAPHVAAEVEVGVVHPHRVAQVQETKADPLPVPRYQVEALLECASDALGPAPAANPGPALEDVHRPDVQRRLGPFGVEEEGVQRAEVFIEGLADSGRAMS